MARGLVFDIQHFCIHDGPGIRTTVFLKGCPLACVWCHNPESQEAVPEIFFSAGKCIGCRYCVQACAKGCHSIEGGTHVYSRGGCVRCGKCTRECYPRALELVGKIMTVEEVLAEVMKDAAFYRNSGGGMTVSGGEPMQQLEFTQELLATAKEAGMHTCIETSGFGAWTRFEEIRPYVDLFLYDIKETDPELHKEFTGVPNQAILENAMALDRAGAAIILRCPIIPKLNDRVAHFLQIAGLANRMQHLSEIHVLPYHPLGASKGRRLGKAPALGDTPMPGETQAQLWASAIQAFTTVKVRIE